MHRRGQYFTIDAFAALLVIATGLLLVLAMYTSRPSPQSVVLSEQFVDTLAQTKIKELNNPFITAQIKEGTITDVDNTLLQQAYEFRRYYDLQLAETFLSNVTPGLVPPHYRFEIVIAGERIHGQGEGQEDAKVLVVTKRILFGVSKTHNEFWGPVVAEVRVWQ